MQNFPCKINKVNVMQKKRKLLYNYINLIKILYLLTDKSVFQKDRNIKYKELDN